MTLASTIEVCICRNCRSAFAPPGSRRYAAHPEDIDRVAECGGALGEEGHVFLVAHHASQEAGFELALHDGVDFLECPVRDGMCAGR